MKKLNGFEQAQAFTGEFETLKAGGYVCKIVNVKDKEFYIEVAFDIAKGENKDFFKKKYDNDTRDNKKWSGKHNIFYNEYQKDECSRAFKGLITSVEKSNDGFKWDWDETKLVGKLFGGVFGEEEYEAGKFATKLRFIRSTEKIEEVEAPARKTLSASNNDDGVVDFSSYDNGNDQVIDF
jgi:hypothetical protein